MKKILLGAVALVLLAFGMQVGAQSVETYNYKAITTATYKGMSRMGLILEYEGLTLAEMQAVRAKGLKLTTAAGKVDDKGGDWVVSFTEIVTSSTGVVAKNGPFTYSGLTYRGYNKLMRVQHNIGGELVAMGEDEAKQGRKGFGHNAH